MEPWSKMVLRVVFGVFNYLFIYLFIYFVINTFSTSVMYSPFKEDRR